MPHGDGATAFQIDAEGRGGGVEVEFSLFDQLHEQGGRKGLGQGSQMKRRVARHRSFLRQVSKAVAFEPQELATAQNARCHPGHAEVFEHFGEVGFQRYQLGPLRVQGGFRRGHDRWRWYVCYIGWQDRGTVIRHGVILQIILTMSCWLVRNSRKQEKALVAGRGFTFHTIVMFGNGAQRKSGRFAFEVRFGLDPVISRGAALA